MFLNFAILATESTDMRLVGQGEKAIFCAVLMVFIALTAKCFAIANRPTTNRKCALSPGVSLIGWIALLSAGFVLQSYPSALASKVLMGFASLFFFGTSITGLVLAIIGLIEYNKIGAHFTQGKKQAVVGLILPGITILSAVMGVARSAPHRTDTTAGTVLRFDVFNYKFTAPGKPWAQVDAKKINPAASLVMMRFNPTIYFMVIAEKLDSDADLTTDTLTEVTKANLSGRASSSRFLSQRPVARHGMSGVMWEAESRIAGNDYHHFNWICATNEYAYQLIAWGTPQQGAEKMRAEVEQIFARFEMIDPTRHAAVGQTTDIASTNYAYCLHLSGTRWHPWKSVERELIFADNGAQIHNTAGVAVVPLGLMGTHPNADALTETLLKTVEVAYPSEKLSEPRPVARQEVSGREFSMQDTYAGVEYDYRLQILQRTNFAYLVMARARHSLPNADQVLDDALARVEFPSVQEPPTADKLNPKQRRTQGLIFNELGLCYFKAKRYEESISYFKVAYQLQSTNPVMLANVVEASVNAGHESEALAFLDQETALVEKDTKLRARQALLQSKLEQNDRALKTYAELFASGFRDDTHFENYVRLLNQTRSSDESLKQVEAYLKQHDSLSIRILQASILRQKKSYNDAIAILKTQREKAPFNLDLAYAMVETYHDAALYKEAIDICEQVISKESDSAYDYYLKGRSQFALKWYRQAKESFEAAQKKAPANAEIKSYLKAVSSVLGEGENSDVKNAIQAVELPESLSQNKELPPADYGKDFGAYYLRHATAVSYKTNQEYRTTYYLNVKVLDSAGVSKFSTMQFGFDRVAQEIFVNKLTVTDRNGNTVATGKPSDYYVVDDATGDVATQKKALTIPIPGLQPGCELELIVTLRDVSPGAQIQFVDHCCSSVYPVLQNVFYLTGDTDSMRYDSTFKTEPQELEKGILWIVKDPLIYRWEPMQAKLDFLPSIWVGGARATWESEASDYLKTIHDRLHIDGAERILVDNLVKQIAGDDRRIAAIAQHVQTNYTYKAIEFGRRARVPQRVEDIVRNRYGDCKDHALLLSQMLQAAGIPAKLALVNSRGPIRKSVPSLDQFDHMIVYLPSYAGGLFIDCSDKSAAVLQSASLWLGGKEALVLDDKVSGFVTIPESSAGSGNLTVTRSIQLTNRTDALVSEKLSVTGFQGAVMRRVLKSLDATGKRRFIFGQMNNPMLEIQELSCAHLDETSLPIEITLQYVIKRQFQVIDKGVIGHLPMIWERHYLAADPVENRQTPFQIHNPFHIQSTVELKLPAGAKLESIKALSENQETPFADWKTAADQKDGLLTFTFDFNQPSGKFPPERYSNYRDTMEKLLGTLERNLVIGK